MPDTTTAALPNGETQQTTATTTTGTTQQTGAATTGTTQQTGQTGQTAQATQTTEAKGWGDDWRKQYAGEDAKLLTRLERYQSPKAALDALIAAQNKISSGELRKPLGENATAEEVAAYRQQNGIPEKPEGYFEKLPDGLVIGDEDKPLFESFAQGLHALNADPKIAQYAVKWYNNLQEEQAAKLSEGDDTHKGAVEDELRSEWGNEYRVNMNHIQGFLSQAPKGVAEMLGNARGADGRAIFNDTATVRWLAQIAREANPVGTIVPAGGGGVEGIGTEIATIEKFMKDNRTAYNKDEKMQARLRDLYDARSKMQQRGAA